ncbi:hypothetical protein Lal_00008524 [Lupinus albus]|nr:hypothetical protein Lal_00008479 [Lupinus albus]KAF1885743.1 hypothetical protein Lal_00008480 [Lupinus albus]KAF1885752.1 hypothetical protein Lal_00008490 [Lupinus albus]KAF1885756.1 hypothetical protein Lal_00008494 [Lupinus albus]KAF1885762.1 hypothetical protein Lal_00008500 [Lupinus albus]
MGDLLGSPRVAPLFSTGGSINGLEILKMEFDRAYTCRCDHTSTNAPDPIRTPQLSVLGRE